MDNNKCVVLLSGGQDSTTCLFWAKQQFDEVHAVTINYGQKHSIELKAAKKVAELAGVASHEVVDVGAILSKPTMEFYSAFNMWCCIGMLCFNFFDRINNFRHSLILLYLEC